MPVTSIIQHTSASRQDLPDVFGAKIPVHTSLNIGAWHTWLRDYHDSPIIEFSRYGWPIDYTGDTLPESSLFNHPSAITFPDHVDHVISIELAHGTLARPYVHNPLHQLLICSPLQTVLKWGSSKCRVVMDLSFPPDHISVYSGIPDNSYLDDTYKLCLPSITTRQRLPDVQTWFSTHVQTALDLHRRIVISSDFATNLLYFDTSCPFGLKTFAMICQPTTQSRITADVYLNDFYGADSPEQAPIAFDSLKALLGDLCFQLAPEKGSPPSTRMVCLGVEVDSGLHCPLLKLGLRNSLQNWTIARGRITHHLFLKLHLECLEFRLSRYYTLDLTEQYFFIHSFFPNH